MQSIFLSIFYIFFYLTRLSGQTEHFPSSWQGNWAGKLDIYTGKGLMQTIDMQLEIQRVDTSTAGQYTWGLIYVSKEQDWRPYTIEPVDSTLGVWKIDEKNSIKMEGYLFHNTFLCWFTVNNNRILCQYEKMGDTLLFEVLSGAETPISITGNTKQNDEEIPEIKTFPLAVYQKAVLKRT